MDVKAAAGKLTLSAFSAGIVIYFDVLAAPLIILIFVMICDYISGMIKAYIAGSLCSKTGIKGLLKKLCYFIAVCVAIGVDWLISIGFAETGIVLQGNMTIALIVTVWLIINEMISILENLSVIGAPLPKFLQKIVNRLKISIDNESEENDND